MKKQGHPSARKALVAIHNKIYDNAPRLADSQTICIKKAPLSREKIFYWGKSK